MTSKDYEDFKRQVDELGIDDTVAKNIHAEQYGEIRDEAKSAYQEQLEKNLEDLREGYSDVTRSEASLRKITEKSPSSIRNFINRILHGTTPEDVAKSKARLVDIQKNYRKEKAEMKALLPRERGVNFVIEKLSRAARNGEISQLNADLAIDLLRTNPSIFEDLAISITKKKGSDESGIQGWYRAADALVKIFKGGIDETTAVHEILHHTERFLPNEIRDKIIKEWHNEVNKQIEHYQKLLKNTTNIDERQQITQGLLYLGLALERQIEPNRANVEAMENIMSKYLGDHTDSKGNFHKGLGNSWYQLYNPSEWWAVNASRILKEAKTKPELKTFYDKVKAFYDGLIQSVKKIFNNPYAAVEKGLKTILDGKTLEDREGLMLSASKELLNIKQKGSFEDRLKSIYDEVKNKQVNAIEDVLGTPKTTNKPIRPTPKESKGQDIEGEVPASTNETGQGNAETTTTILDEKTEPSKVESEVDTTPPKTPNEEKYSEEGDDMFRFKKAEFERARDSVGLSFEDTGKTTREKEYKKSADAISEWKKEGTYTENINDILERAKDGRISVTEQFIFARHLADLDAAVNSIEDINSEEYARAYKPYKEALLAAESVRIS